MQMFADNIRFAKKIGERLYNLARAAYAEAHVNEEGLFGASAQRPVSQLFEEQLGVTVESGSQQPDAGTAAETGQPGGNVPAPVNDERQPQAAEGRAEQPAGRGEPGAQGKGVAGEVTNEFIAAPDGSLNLGEITPGIVTAIGRQAGNIRLTRGPQNADKSGYGQAGASKPIMADKLVMLDSTALRRSCRMSLVRLTRFGRRNRDSCLLRFR